MKFLFVIYLLLLLFGCGSGGNSASVTPVMADTRGTYRLSSGRLTTTDLLGVMSSTDFTSGTLRLTETGYRKTLVPDGAAASSGSYSIGPSVNTIINSTSGSFSLTPNGATVSETGVYRVEPDLTLTLFYTAPGGSLAGYETWVKVSDSPHFGE